MLIKRIVFLGLMGLIFTGSSMGTGKKFNFIDPSLFQAKHEPGPLWLQTLRSARDGYLDGMRQSVKNLSSNMFVSLGNSLQRAKLLAYTYIHKFAYRNQPLKVIDLMRISNHIYTLCLPFAKFSPATMNKERRAQAFLGSVDLPEGMQLDTNNWKRTRKELIAELQFGISYLKRALPAHNIEYLNAASGGLQEKFASLFKMFSLHDDMSVSFYLIRTMVYIQGLIELLESFASFEDAQQQFEETQRWLNCITQSFSQVAHFIDPEVAQGTFSRFNTSKQGANTSMNSLEALLGQLK